MDLDSGNLPQFSVGSELATLIATCGILPKAWESICSISKNEDDSFLLENDEDVVYVTFPSFDREDFIVPDSKYGEWNIQNEKIFTTSLEGDDAKPAFVLKGAFYRFVHVLENSDFKAKMQDLKEQVIIFVGHSTGGAVAALATLWFLEKRLRNSNSFCVTFGAPLFGNVTIQEAIVREDWLGRFCHVVCKYDIVPRMYLAPYESIAKPLDTILPHWRSKMGIDCVALSHLSMSEACMTLLENVLTCTSTVANNYPGFRSPFVPIGTYMFCSTHGAACFEDSEAVLKLLHFSMQRLTFAQMASSSISDHTDYGHILEGIDRSLLNAKQFVNFVSNSFKIGIALELEAIGVGAQTKSAFDALKKAADLKTQHDMDIKDLNLELSENQSRMAELEWYIKTVCKGISCSSYDVFGHLSEKKDFHINRLRANLQDFWDKIIDMVKNHQLPSDFRYQNKWINAGSAYRKLVEPLDIAEFYHLHSDKGSYLSTENRPLRHRVLEKWLEDKNQTRIERGRRDKKARTKFASLTEDSRFWARVEEADKDLTNLQQRQEQTVIAHLKKSLKDFEVYVSKMIDEKSISMEVFFEESSFMIWWKNYREFQLQYSEEWKSSSPLLKSMEKEKLGVQKTGF